MLWIAGWVAMAGLNWWLLEKSWLIEFPDLTLGNRASLIGLAVFGPAALPTAVLSLIGAYNRERASYRRWVNQIVRRRSGQM